MSPAFDWGRLAGSQEARARVEYLERLRRIRPVRAVARRLLDLADLRAGARFLDVGCGAGQEVRAAAGRVRPAGLAVGLDRSVELVAVARERARAQGGLAFVVGDAAALPFRSNSFDAAICYRVLQHVAQPEVVLGEVARVLRPGGVLAVAEPDWGTSALGGGDEQASLAVLSAAALLARHPRIGRRLPALLGAAGFQVERLEGRLVLLRRLAEAAVFLDLGEMARRAVAAGWLSEATLERWLGELRAADRAETFVFAITLMIARGRKAADPEQRAVPPPAAPQERRRATR